MAVSSDLENMRRTDFENVSIQQEIAMATGPAELPEVYKNIINNNLGGCASEAVLVMQRRLFSPDVDFNNRLFLPGAIIKSLVTETERRKLDKGFPYGWIKVLLLEPSLYASTLYLEEDLDTFPVVEFDYEGYDYTLTGFWSDVVEDNHLEEGMNVQLWSFRIISSNNKLCFALVVL